MTVTVADHEADTGLAYNPYPPPVVMPGRTYGLFTAGPIVDEPDDRIAAGITYPYDCDCVSEAITDFCQPPPVTPPAGPSVVLRDAVNLRVHSKICFAVVRPSEEDKRDAAARSKLIRTEQQALENALWSHPGLRQAFTNVTATILSAEPVPPLCALSLLDQWAAAQCWPVVVHAPVAAETALCCEGMIKETAGRYLTPTGTQIVFGGGYPGTGPGGTAPPENTTWIYATGPVRLLRGDLHVRLGDGYTDNEYLDRAERLWVPDYACDAVAAVPVRCVRTIPTTPVNSGRRYVHVDGADGPNSTEAG